MDENAPTSPAPAPTKGPPTYKRDRTIDPTVPTDDDLYIPQGVDPKDDLINHLVRGVLRNPALPIIHRRIIEEKHFKITDPKGYEEEIQRRAMAQFLPPPSKSPIVYPPVS